jgi:hypothetical protein
MKKPTTLPTDIAAVWGAFLYEGFMMTEHQLGRDNTLMDYWPQGGYLELMTEACACLNLVWESALEYDDFQTQHNSVFEYEVISALGQYMSGYMVKHPGSLPPKEELAAAIKHLLLTFFCPPHSFLE